MALTEEEKKERRRKSSNKYYAGNRDKIRAKALVNSEKKKVYCRAYRKAKGRELLDLQSERGRRHIDSLSDLYVANTIIGKQFQFKKRDIPQGLIELKRQFLRIHRLIKERQQA